MSCDKALAVQVSNQVSNVTVTSESFQETVWTATATHSGNLVLTLTKLTSIAFILEQVYRPYKPCIEIEQKIEKKVVLQN